jgi:hypothetical protein
MTFRLFARPHILLGIEIADRGADGGGHAALLEYLHAPHPAAARGKRLPKGIDANADRADDADAGDHRFALECHRYSAHDPETLHGLKRAGP